MLGAGIGPPARDDDEPAHAARDTTAAARDNEHFQGADFTAASGDEDRG
jgi:hypothetical protein